VSLSPIFTPYGSIKAIKFVGDREHAELEAVRNVLGLEVPSPSQKTHLVCDCTVVAGVMSLGMSQWGAYNLARQVSIPADFGALLSRRIQPEFKCGKARGEGVCKL